MIIAFLREIVRDDIHSIELDNLVFEMFLQPLLSAFEECIFRFDGQTGRLVISQPVVTTSASRFLEKKNAPYTTTPPSSQPR